MKTIKTTNRINKLSKTIFALAVIAITFSACKKDEQITPEPEPAPEKVRVLASGNWVMQSTVINGNDVTTYIDDCEIDNVTVFKTDGTYVTDEGVTKCDPNDKQTTGGVWEFTNNYTKLLIDKEDAMSVTLLTKDSLHVVDTTYEDGTMYVTELTFLTK